jgi:tetratricopeptide (TPR) repeat protein
VEILRTSAINLKSLWDKNKTNEGPLIDASLPHNLAVAYRVLGDHESAGQVLDEALAKNSDALDLIRERAAVHLVLDEEVEALELLQEKAGKDPDAAVMIAEQLLKKDPKAARKVLDDINKPETEESERLSASFLQAESYFKEKNPEVGLEQANILVKKYPERIEVLVFLALCQNRCDDPSSDETLTRAMEMLDGTSSFYDRFITAKELEKRQRYDGVVDVLDGWVDLTRDTPALRMLLPAMINSDRRQRLHNAVKNLPKDIAGIPFYLRVQAATHMIRGDYPAAEKIIDQYFKLSPPKSFYASQVARYP